MFLDVSEVPKYIILTIFEKNLGYMAQNIKLIDKKYLIF